MNLELNEKEKKLKAFLMEIPPDLNSAEVLLKQEPYSVESISKVGTDFAWECVESSWEYLWDDDIVRSEEVIPGLHSTYICEVLELLLQYGLDPNAVFEDNNIMDHMRYLDNGYLAADALVMLLEHGGNPNLPCNGATIFDDIDFDVLYDAEEQRDRQRYSSMVHCWMVYLAYGGVLQNGNPVGKAMGNFDIRELKKHRNFYFGISSGEHWLDIHIYRKGSLWEVYRA